MESRLFRKQLTGSKDPLEGSIPSSSEGCFFCGSIKHRMVIDYGPGPACDLAFGEGSSGEATGSGPDAGDL